MEETLYCPVCGENDFYFGDDALGYRKITCDYCGRHFYENYDEQPLRIIPTDTNK